MLSAATSQGRMLRNYFATPLSSVMVYIYKLHIIYDPTFSLVNKKLIVIGNNIS